MILCAKKYISLIFSYIPSMLEVLCFPSVSLLFYINTWNEKKDHFIFFYYKKKSLISVSEFFNFGHKYN